MTDFVRAAGLAVVVVLAGCGYNRSIAERNLLGGNSVISGLSADTAADAATAHIATTPTVSLSRQEWPPVDFVVPVDGTVHGPLWRMDAVAKVDTPRGKALYPTAESALDLREHSPSFAYEALLEPFVAIGNVIGMPVLAFMDPPGNHQSPSKRSLYKRSGHGRTMAGSIPGSAEAPYP